jgi:hypothetical protein
VEAIVVADEAEAVVAELNGALDRLEESHTLFGGGIRPSLSSIRENEGDRHSAHTIAVGETVAGALKAERDGTTVALRAVI